MPRGARSLLALLALTAACSGGGSNARVAPASTTSPSTTTVSAVSGSTSTAPGAPTTSTSSSPDASGDKAPPATAPAPPFASAVDVVTAADLPSTWREGCPVGPESLRRLTLSHWGFDDSPHSGTMVVNEAVVDAVVAVFRSLYDARFPIRLMQPVDAYGGSDDASIAADNTAAFNCRAAVANGPPQWSQHAFGLAIDVNPLENPSVLNGVVYPPAGEPYLDRSDERPGMALPGGPLVNAFAAIGWSWGGQWANVDYQHFSQNGR